MCFVPVLLVVAALVLVDVVVDVFGVVVDVSFLFVSKDVVSDGRFVAVVVRRRLK